MWVSSLSALSYECQTGLTWLPDRKFQLGWMMKLKIRNQNGATDWVVSLYFHMAFLTLVTLVLITTNSHTSEKIYTYQKAFHFAKANYTVSPKHFVLATMAELSHGEIFIPVADIKVVETGLSFPLSNEHILTLKWGEISVTRLAHASQLAGHIQ